MPGGRVSSAETSCQKVRFSAVWTTSAVSAVDASRHLLGRVK